MDLAGLPFHEFFCPVNGWYSPRAPETGALPLAVEAVSKTINSVCARLLSIAEADLALVAIGSRSSLRGGLFHPVLARNSGWRRTAESGSRQPLRTLALQVATRDTGDLGRAPERSAYTAMGTAKFCFHPLGSDSVVIE